MVLGVVDGDRESLPRQGLGVRLAMFASTSRTYRDCAATLAASYLIWAKTSSSALMLAPRQAFLGCVRPCRPAKETA